MNGTADLGLEVAGLALKTDRTEVIDLHVLFGAFEECLSRCLLGTRVLCSGPAASSLVLSRANWNLGTCPQGVSKHIVTLRVTEGCGAEMPGLE